nr:hypothetical protein [Janibacter terrae]
MAGQVLPAGDAATVGDRTGEGVEADGHQDLGLVGPWDAFGGGDAAADDRQQRVGAAPGRGPLVRGAVGPFDGCGQRGQRGVDDGGALGVEVDAVAGHPARAGGLGQRAGGLGCGVLVVQVLLRAQHPPGLGDRGRELLLVQPADPVGDPPSGAGGHDLVTGDPQQDPQVLLEEDRVGDPAHRLVEAHQLVGLAQRQTTLGDRGPHLLRGRACRCHPHHLRDVLGRGAGRAAPFADPDPVVRRPRRLARQAPADALGDQRDLGRLQQLTRLPDRRQRVRDLPVSGLPGRGLIRVQQRAHRVPQARHEAPIAVLHVPH